MTAANHYDMKAATPLMRIFDEAKAREFYLDYLGFRSDWEHRFEAGMPLYMQISLGGCILHLTEHHGDCSPGSALRIEVENIKNYHGYLKAQQYKYARPGIGQSFGCDEVCVTDPFGNRITFYERVQENV
jgi:catechol 2,3-dioxygenase-like lactoylglutathione lyase family enzyme